jgi:hypothetical protein
MLEIFNPASKIYGFISICASVGTLSAVVVAITSLKQTRKQASLNSKKNTIDHFFRELDSILDQLIFIRQFGNSEEIHFGRSAIYMANISHGLLFIRNKNNMTQIGNYIDTMNLYIGAVAVLLSNLEDKREVQIYKRKIQTEYYFAEEYLKKLLQQYIVDESKSELVDSARVLLGNLEGLKENAIELKLFSMA